MYFRREKVTSGQYNILWMFKITLVVYNDERLGPWLLKVLRFVI